MWLMPGIAVRVAACLFFASTGYPSWEKVGA